MLLSLVLGASLAAAASKTPARVELPRLPTAAGPAGQAPRLVGGRPEKPRTDTALPQLAEASAAATAASPETGRLSAAFDGVLRSRGDDLVALAEPWRTDRQLERLSASPRGEQETVRFAVVGDGEEGRYWHSRALFNKPGVFAEQLKAADSEDVDFVVQLGDMVSRGTAKLFRRFFRMLGGLGLTKPLLTTPGNHDRHRPHGRSHLRLYERLFGRTDYLLDRGGWRFVFLDSSARRLTPDQLSWLDRSLDTERRTVVFTHVPPGPLSRWTDWGPFKGAGGIGEGGAEFASIVAARGVEAVFVGHIHAFDRLVHRGVTYYLTGGGGSPLYPAPVKTRFHHYLHVEAGPGPLKVSVRPHSL